MAGNVALTGNTSIATYQNLDGSNFTLMGGETKWIFKDQNASVALFGGFGTNFENGMAVGDVKLTHNYSKYLNQNFRTRMKAGEDVCSMELRYSPCTVNVPINKNMSWYANPNGRLKIDFNTGKIKPSADIFTGLSFKNKKGNLSGFAEVEWYNMQERISAKNIGFNIGGSWSF